MNARILTSISVLLRLPSKAWTGVEAEPMNFWKGAFPSKDIHILQPCS